MGFFKEKKKEQDVVHEFIEHMKTSIEGALESIQKIIRIKPPINGGDLYINLTMTLFLEQIQALPNLFKPQQANHIRNLATQELINFLVDRGFNESIVTNLMKKYQQTRVALTLVPNPTTHYNTQSNI